MSDQISSDAILSRVLPKSLIPQIFSEWLALFPLVCHLATPHHNYQLAGEASLMGRISLGLFPPLGLSTAIARFLEEGNEFVERAAAAGNDSSTVWDVNWCSTFPCANASARATISDYALRSTRGVITVPDTFPKHAPVLGKRESAGTEGEEACQKPSAKSPGIAARSPVLNIPMARQNTRQSVFDMPNRRYQILHVLDFSRSQIQLSWQTKAWKLLSSPHSDTVFVVILLGLAALLSLYGLYGTAATIIASAISRVVCRFLGLRHSSDYLTNNENHDACMLVGAHQNCTTWFLYIGDRGLVDFLLNKPMLSIPKPNLLLSSWFKALNLIQLLSMTYVAAAKNWDGVALTALLVLNWIISWAFRNRFMAQRWIETMGVEIRARTFQLSGRTQMIAAIQSFNGGQNSEWMDSIIAPNIRRQALLDRIGCLNDQTVKSGAKSAESTSLLLSQFDEEWVAMQAELTRRAVDVLRAEFPGQMRNRCRMSV